MNKNVDTYLLGRVQIRTIPVYLLGQFLGAFFGAAVVFGVYYDSIIKLDQVFQNVQFNFKN